MSEGKTFIIDGHEYLDAVALAAQVGMSRLGVLRLARLGRVPYYRVGKRWLFSPSEFLAALKEEGGRAWRDRAHLSVVD
jgi:excisionase family DNA binding protein